MNHAPTSGSQQGQHRSEQQPLVAMALPRPSSRGNMDLDGLGISGHGIGRRQTSSGSRIMGGDRSGYAFPDTHTRFFTPSYLRRSNHVRRLQKAYEEHVAELQEHARLNPPPKPPSLSHQSSHASLKAIHSAPPFRPAPLQDVTERLPSVMEEGRLRPLPSRWNDLDKMSGLEVLMEGTEVRFVGVTKTSDEAASIRSDYPMPRECGLYYFEITILSKSKDGLIGIGFSSRKANLNRLPGWESESWAYHGDDGYSFSCTASGKQYGPRYASQDVIGCGINFRTGVAFFTKNGVYLGEDPSCRCRNANDQMLTNRTDKAFTGINTDLNLYPSVGMKKPGEHLRVNFGRQPFVYDIDSMMEQERQSVLADISKADVSSLHPPDNEDALIHKLIGQYLAHEGYVETAKAFERDVHDKKQSLSSNPQPFQLPDSDDDIHAINRQKIRKSILDGDIDLALKFTSSFYPHVLEEERNKDIYFRLKCRKFIEMMRRYYDMVTATSSPTVVTKATVGSLESNGHAEFAEVDEDDEDEDEDEDEQQNVVDGDEQDTQMELDDQIHREVPKRLEVPPPTDDVDMDASQELPPKASFMKKDDLQEAALNYGSELKHEFGSDPRPQIQKALTDLFAIVAYINPADSPIGDLLDVRGRVRIAEEVNGAILGMFWVDLLFAFLYFLYLAGSLSQRWVADSKNQKINQMLTMHFVYSIPRSAFLRRPGETLHANRTPARRYGKAGRGSCGDDQCTGRFPAGVETWNRYRLLPMINL